MDGDAPKSWALMLLLSMSVTSMFQQLSTHFFLTHGNGVKIAIEFTKVHPGMHSFYHSIGIGIQS